MTDLRDELERIADRAPSIDVSPDLYARARRSGARARVVAVAAAAACLALVVGLVAVGPWHVGAGPQPGDGQHRSAVVPDRIYVPDDDADLPVQVKAGSPMQAPVVAAYVLDGTKPTAVLIHGDGSYARLDLPGLATGMDTGDTEAFALSPDGTHLAYYSRDTTHRTAITIVAFGAGDSWGSIDVRIGGRLGAYAHALRWADDSRSLVWTGQPITSWKDGLHFSTREVAGVLDVAGNLSMLPTVAGGWGGAGICDGGTAVTVNGKGTWSSSGAPAQRTGPGRGGVLATGCPNGSPTAVLSSDVPSGDPRAVLGWSADGLPVVTAAGIDTAGDTDRLNVSIVASTADGPVAVADLGAGRLTLATGLMSGHHPTASVPRPGWAPHPISIWVWLGGGLACGAIVAALLSWWRRARMPKGHRDPLAPP